MGSWWYAARDFEADNDRTFVLYLDEQPVFSTDYDELGWAGLGVLERLAMTLNDKGVR